MNRFENVDIIASLEQIMQTNTKNYKSDFVIDKEMLIQAAYTDDRDFLWMSHRNGTWCFKERDVFLKDTPRYNTWTYYSDERPLAYAVRIMSVEDGILKGNLYELDYLKHIEMVKESAVQSDNLIAYFDYGTKLFAPEETEKILYENPLYVEYVPNNADALRYVINMQHQNREKLPPGDIKEHISELAEKAVRNKLKSMSTDEKQAYIDMIEMSRDYGEGSAVSRMDNMLYDAILKSTGERKPSIRGQLKTSKSVPSVPVPAKVKEDLSL